jgi:hypothetical protein
VRCDAWFDEYVSHEGTKERRSEIEIRMLLPFVAQSPSLRIHHSAGRISFHVSRANTSHRAVHGARPDRVLVLLRAFVSSCAPFIVIARERSATATGNVRCRHHGRTKPLRGEKASERW